jgi:hypothetical protein
MLLFHTMERSSRQHQSKLPLDRLLICVAVLLMIGGVIVRTRIPIIPLADGDTWGYLRPALSWLSGFGFAQTYGRDWLYPALLAGILRVGGDFSAITYVQRFLGIGGIIVAWLAWRSWFRLLPASSPLCRWLGCILALSMLALYALSSQQAILESTIRPEGMLAFFEMAYLYSLLSFFGARWKLRRPGRAIFWGALSVGLSYAVLLLKPSWGFSFGLTLLFLIAGSVGQISWPIRFGPLLGGVIVCGFLFLLPKWLGFQKDAQLFLPFTLVSIHAAQILETSPNQDSPGANSSAAIDPLFYEELTKAFQTAKKASGHYNTLGFDPDYIQYRSGFFSAVMHRKGWNDRQLAAACYSAYFHAWIKEPSLMLRKIWKQAKLFLFPRAGDFYTTTKSIDLNRELANSRPFLPESQFSPDVQKIYRAYLESLESAGRAPLRPFGIQVLAKLALYLAWAAFWLQLCFFLAMLFVCLKRRGRALRLAGFALVAVLAATYGNVLTIAVVHSLDVVRYRVSYAPGFLLGLAMITNYLLVFLWRPLGFSPAEPNHSNQPQYRSQVGTDD